MNILVDQSCQSVTISYQEFNITWNDTLAGDTVEAPCMGHGLSGQRLIDMYLCIHTGAV